MSASALNNAVFIHVVGRPNLLERLLWQNADCILYSVRQHHLDDISSSCCFHLDKSCKAESGAVLSFMLCRTNGSIQLNEASVHPSGDRGRVLVALGAGRHTSQHAPPFLVPVLTLDLVYFSSG